MSRFRVLFSQLRLLREGVTLTRAIRQRTHNYVMRLCDNVVVLRWRCSRWRREHYVRGALHCVRQALESPRRRALMLSATGAYKKSTEEEAREERPDYVTDEELQELVHELDRVAELSKATLYCPKCSLRRIIDTRHPGVTYCTCKKPSSLEDGDGWLPYMETHDVIIWRKEYKKGHGLYAYKVYGRYSNVSAVDFAAVQTDTAYRRAWDNAVASLATVENSHRGDADQSVIHWEVMWPRLFANRDYVYVRRHKEFSTPNQKPIPTTERTSETNSNESDLYPLSRRSNIVRAKRKESPVKMDNRVVVIVSKSCEHPKCPETKNAIRVTEYWSHMVIRSMDGIEKPGMEFVLTYYDEPAVGGMPGGVAAWATGRAAPDYLARMRAAAAHYQAWLHEHSHSEEASYDATESSGQEAAGNVREEDMESSNRGPIIENGDWSKSEAKSEETKPVKTEAEVETKANRANTYSEAATKANDVLRTQASGSKATEDVTPQVNTEAATKSNGVEAIRAKEEVRPQVNNEAKTKGNGATVIQANEEVSPNITTEAATKSKGVEAIKANEEVGPQLNSDTATKGDGPAASKAVRQTDNSDTESVNQPKTDTIKDTEPVTSTSSEKDEDGERCDDDDNSRSWWRYLYPYYYFA